MKFQILLSLLNLMFTKKRRILSSHFWSYCPQICDSAANVRYRRAKSNGDFPQLNLSLTATKSRIQRARVLLKEQIIARSTMEINAKGKPISIEFKSNCKPLQDHQKNKS